MHRQTHNFSPILDEDRLNGAIEYVAAGSLSLARAVLQRELAIDTICFFAQTGDEYTFLEAAVHARGPVSRLSHDPTLYVESDFYSGEQHITIFGIRRPDPTRRWVGYGDYPLAHDDFEALAAADNPHIIKIESGRGQALLELHHPDFDVLGYACREEEHHV